MNRDPIGTQKVKKVPIGTLLRSVAIKAIIDIIFDNLYIIFVNFYINVEIIGDIIFPTSEEDSWMVFCRRRHWH